MPESSGRTKKGGATKGAPAAQKIDRSLQPSPRWWAPLMVTLMVIGLLWVVVFYVSQAALPVKSLGNWNILVGFAFMLVGFLMTTRWR